MTNNTNLHKNEYGIMLVTVMIVCLILTFVGLSIIDLVLQQYARTDKDVYVANANLTAEAGIEQSVKQLNDNNNSFTGYTTPQQLFNSTSQGVGQFTTAVTSGTSQNEKVITSTGIVYRKGNLAKPISTRKVKVTVVGTQSQGYSVQTGPGGLLLGGSASIVNSDVYIGGKLSMTGASKIGTQSQPVPVNVAYQACPSGTSPGSSYPAVCTTGQPISMAYSTAIYGTVCATGQTSSNPSGNPNGNIFPGTGGGGLQNGCTAPPVSQPTYDRAGQIAAVTTSVPSTDNTYGCNSYSSTQKWKRTWPANLKFTGNVSVANSCDITIKGNVYITGDLTIGGSSKITVDDSVGTTRPVIVVDGKITVGGSGSIIANSSGTGIQFISFKNSLNNSAATPTGTDLYNSSQLETVNVGGAVNLPGMVFQAYWGKITIAGSGNIGAAVGQTVDLSGAGTITFGTILSSGSRTWTIRSYQQVYN